MTESRILSGNSPVVEELTQLLGREAVLRLCEAVGGVRTYIPRKLGGNHTIVAAIGRPLADLLAEHYHGSMLDLPKAHIRRQRAIELAKSGELTIREVALQTDYSERHLYRLLKPEDDGQLDLFRDTDPT